MPTYDYECGACGEACEFFQPISEAPKRKCPNCGKLKLKRLIGAGAGLIFKGSGFYITDYRSSDYQAKAKAESEGAKSTSSDSSSSESKSDSGGNSSDTSKSGDSGKSGGAAKSESSPESKSSSSSSGSKKKRD